MTYQMLDTAPEWVQHVPGKSADKPRWSGEMPPPEPGTEVLVAIKNNERVTVVGYFTEGNYLGVRCRPAGGDHDWHLFGAEINLP